MKKKKKCTYRVYVVEVLEKNFRSTPLYTVLVISTVVFSTLVPPPPPYIGVGVGWQRRCKTCQSLRELDNQGTVSFLFLAVTGMVIE